MMIFIPPYAAPPHHHAQIAVVEPDRDWKEPLEESHGEREDYTPNGWDSRFASNTAAVTGASIREGDAQWGVPAPNSDLLYCANSALQNSSSPKQSPKSRFGQQSRAEARTKRASLRRQTDFPHTCRTPRPAPSCLARRFVRDRRV